MPLLKSETKALIKTEYKERIKNENDYQKNIDKVKNYQKMLERKQKYKNIKKVTSNPLIKFFVLPKI